MYCRLPRVVLMVSFTLICSTAMLYAQPKPALKHSDYEIWNSATGFRLAPDGQSMAYFFSPAKGDGALVIKQFNSNKEIRIPSGGKSASSSSASPTTRTLPTPAPAVIVYTPDSKKIILSLAPPASAIDKARSAKKKASEFPRTEVVMIEVATGKILDKFERARNFSIQGTGAGLLVYQRDPESSSKEKEESPKPKEEPAKLKEEPKAAKMKEVAPKPQEKPKGTPMAGAVAGTAATQPPAKDATPPTRPATRSTPDLVVRNLADGKDVVLEDVTEFSITKDDKELVYVVQGKDADKQGVFVTPLGQAKPTPIKVGSGRYTRLSWDDKQTKLAFFMTDTPAPASKTEPKSQDAKDTKESKETPVTPTKPSLRVYLWSRTGKAEPAKEIIGTTVPGMKEGWSIQERGGLNFSADGLKLQLATVPIPEPTPRTTNEAGETPSTPGAGTRRFPRGATPPGTTPPASGATPTRSTAEQIDLDLWHWKDENIQPMQKIRGAIDRNRTFRAVYLLDTKKFVQLADENTNVTVPDHGDWAIASSDARYRGQLWLSPRPSDLGFLNIRTGEAKPLAQGVTGTPARAPKAEIMLMFDGKDWNSIAIPSGKKINLTAKLKVNFFNEEFDSPSAVPPYSFPQWTKDEKFVLLSDRYDIWKIAVDGSSATNLTKIGRDLTTRFRMINLPDESNADDTPGVDLSKPMLLGAENLITRDSGFYRLLPGQSPKLLVMGARDYGTPTKAKNTGTMIFTVSTFYDYPDYYVSDSEFREIKRVTDINPRVREFNWGKAEIVQYKTADGVPLTGMLIKPEDFDPSKKYPMVVYIYERLSQNVHRFVLPRAGTSINPTYYASNGYLVFMPDITYTIGSPGQSALKCVLPAIQSVVDKGYVKEDAIGIQGHSWGGYQIAYMVTQTNRFKAANAGAPVSNMVSAYGGIRWGSGLPRQFQYEQTQSRIGGTLWNSTMRYIENSPVFMADRVETPLMMLHNDQDDAVPWYQGIEYYLALRRLNKEVYLFNYNGEFHGLRKKATQRDYTIRMQQFFDHYLKGAPKPEWMEKGIPYSERDKEKEQWKKLFEPEKK